MMAGLRVWNYNKSPEDTYRGVGTSEEPCLYSQGFKDCTERARKESFVMSYDWDYLVVILI